MVKRKGWGSKHHQIEYGMSSSLGRMLANPLKTLSFVSIAKYTYKE
jgi:hypothetical protein